MTKFAKIISILALLLILIIGALMYSRKNDVVNTNVDEPTQVISSSIKGCYVARLSKDVYTLVIRSEDGQSVSGVLSYNNYEKDSSSGPIKGIFANDILLVDYSFNSEGMDSNSQLIFKRVGDSFIQGFGNVKIVDGKEVFDNISTVTYDSKSKFVKSDDCTETFTDADKTFSYKYNSFWKNIEGDRIPTLDWRVDAKQKGMLLSRVLFYKSYLPNTNFSNAKLTIGASTDPDAIKSCTTVTAGNGITKSEVTISGYPFVKVTTGDAGAGNYYETTSYRGLLDGDCYVIEYTIHSTSIAAYSPDQGIKEFDKAQIESELEEVVKSFKFLVNSD